MGDRPVSPFIGTTAAEGWIIFGICLVAAILIGVFFGEDRGWIAGDSVGALACLIVIAWPLRKERWFWITFAVFAAVNALAVVRFDWSFTHNWTGHAITALGILDLMIMAAITYGVYSVIYGAPAEAVAELPDEGPSYSERDLDL